MAARRTAKPRPLPTFDPVPSAQFGLEILGRSKSRRALIGRVAMWYWRDEAGPTVWVPGLGARFSLSLDLVSDVLDGQALKGLHALCGVVAATSSELVEEAYRIHDAEFLDEDIRGVLNYLRDGLKLCAHFVTSDTRPSTDTILQASLEAAEPS